MNKYLMKCLQKINTFHIVIGLLLLIIVNYMIFFVKYPIEDSMEITLANDYLHWLQNDHNIFKDNVLISMSLLSIFLLPILMIIMAFLKKIYILLLSLISLFSSLIILFLLINTGNPFGIGDPFIPYVILCSIILMLIIFQYIVNIKFYKTRKNK